MEFIKKSIMERKGGAQNQGFNVDKHFCFTKYRINKDNIM